MKHHLAVNQKYTLKSERFADRSDVVAFVGETPIYFPYAIPGEEVKVEITEVHKNFARAQVLEIVSPSRSRVDPPCPYFYLCGGCQWQHMDMKAQLHTKRWKVQSALKDIHGLTKEKVKSTLPSSEVYHYRNKAQQPVSFNGIKAETGFFRPGTHELIAIETCAVQSEHSNQIIQSVMALIALLNIAPYDEKLDQGVLRYILVREGFRTGEMMLILVTRVDEDTQIHTLAEKITAQFPKIVSVIQNVNSEKTNVILGPVSRVLLGRSFIYEIVQNLKFKISPESFFQVNTAQAEKICEIVEKMIGPKPAENIVDLYCGVGLMGLFLARGAKHVYGIENVPKAIEDALENAQINHIENAHFICKDARAGLQQLKIENIKASTVLLDPPRQGCPSEVIDAIVEITPETIIYISCDLKSLARDMGRFIEKGYSLLEVQPIDLFPQTAHVECVVKMERSNKK